MRHPEIPLLSDGVIPSDDCVIQESAHFQGGMVPEGRRPVEFPLMMGPTRGRYFLLTGQALPVDEAQRIGLVNEILPKAQYRAGPGSSPGS